jgi:oxygen-independent coproporphyrinogen-3 oxidase
VESVDEKMLAEDSIIFGLRMNRGVNLRAMGDRFHTIDFSRLDELFSELVRGNLMESRDGWIRLTDGGRLVADAIGREVLKF